MVILKITNPANPEFECEDPSSTKEDANLVRPCERYKEMYSSCRSIRHRFHQYYVYGELLDCKIYSNLYNSCIEFRNKKEEKCLEPIIEWERNYFYTRMQTVNQNKTWVSRTEPPKDFEAPLPAYLEKLHKDSLFRQT